jgi:hypothetical protein
VLDRLAESERVFSERLAAVESLIARVSQGGQVNLQPIANRLDVIEEAVLLREGEAAIGARLAELEAAHKEERSALASIADELNGLSTAVALAAQRHDEAQSSFGERLQQITSGLDQHRIDLASGIGDRIAALEQAIGAQEQRSAETHGTYREELGEVHDALMKLNSNQHTLAGAIDQWRGNDSGEIHMINARIGAVQEDGSRRLQVLEKLNSDVQTLAGLVRLQAEKPRRNWRRWLFGTDDWARASWRQPPPPAPEPEVLPPAESKGSAWRVSSWRLPFRRKDTDA